jgi:parallel beta-helix repeat protein
MIRFALSLLLLLPALAAAPARAAESYDSCAGFITALPAVLTTQGVWCLDRDLSSNLSTGFTIEVDANNVTIDCNGYKLGGLSAGDGTLAYGIYTDGRSNTVVRNCNIRGFHTAVSLTSLAGNFLVEDNRIDNNTANGIIVSGDGSVVRRNYVVETGGTTIPVHDYAYGIYTSGTVDVVDNTVRGLTIDSPNSGMASGIRIVYGSGSLIARNTVGDINHAQLQPEYGISLDIWTAGAVIRENNLLGTEFDTGTAIHCETAASGARLNISTRWDFDIVGCNDLGGNVTQ